MSTQPLAAAKFREFDANGNPLVGGKLYTYAAGTTTPLATYTDSTGSVANANPVVLDAAGRADVWLTPGVLYKFVLQDAAGNVQYTEDNFPSPIASGSSPASASAAATDPGGRLTLAPGTPVTDASGVATIYYAPYRHGYVPIFDGTNWALQSIGSGLSQATTDNTKSPAAVANNSNYDLFVWNDAGTIRLSRGPAWTSDTARGTGVGTTEITQQNGRWVNKNGITNGPGALLGTYVGTVRSDGSAQINDNRLKRHVWNAYISSRVKRNLLVQEPAVNWTYATATWRQANGNAANQVEYVCGLAEDAIEVDLLAMASLNETQAQVGIGIDSTTSPSGCISGMINTPLLTSAIYNLTFRAAFRGVPGLGRHYLSWLEIVTSGSASFSGKSDGNASTIWNEPALFGSVMG